MDNSDHLKELNAMPVNERARSILIQSGEVLLDGSMHCVQVALCAIDRGLVVVETDVAETVRAMMAWRPQRFVNFFMLMNVEEYEPEGWEGAAGLRELAEIILNDIEDRMVTHFPYYRSPES